MRGREASPRGLAAVLDSPDSALVSLRAKTAPPWRSGTHGRTTRAIRPAARAPRTQGRGRPDTGRSAKAGGAHISATVTAPVRLPRNLAEREWGGALGSGLVAGP